MTKAEQEQKTVDYTLVPDEVYQKAKKKFIAEYRMQLQSKGIFKKQYKWTTIIKFS